MKIEEIKNKFDWENFLFNCKEKTFLNSWNWGEFNETLGNKIWRFGLFDGQELISLAPIIKIKAKRGNFLFLPHGPNINKENGLKFEILRILLENLKSLAQKEKCDFIKVAPIWLKNSENITIFKKLGFRDAPLHIHPEITWELEIIEPEEKILKKMRKTTRYLIKQAEKNKNIEIEEKNDPGGIEEFNKLYQLTVKRQKFSPFSLDYLKKEFLAFSKDNQISVLLGKYKRETVAGGIFIFWQKIAFYHHGASSQKYPKIPVSYLLLWEAIKKAKERGCERFNFWGICDLNNKKHPWYGLSLFKVGFGGEKKEYVKTQDLPISPKYWLNYLIEIIRKIKRRY